MNVRLRDLNEPPHFELSALELAKTPVAFPERRRDLTVVRLSAVEPDGDGLRWELVGPDESSFSVDDGRISFRSRPDFERPGSISGANMYTLKVVVTELSAVGDGPLRSAELPLTIEVTNRGDPGTVDFSALQPEVGTPLTARLVDVDAPVSDVGWTWHVAKVGSPALGEGTDLADLAPQWRQIPGAGSDTYTPAGVDADTSPPSGAAVDEGRYLLARATYTDALGDDNVALAMPAHPVRPDVSDAANNAPAFRAGAVTITVPESLAIGEPVGPSVAVEMNIDDEVLTYDLDDDFDRDNDVDTTGDLAFFSIDRTTGQLHLEKTLSHEATDGRDHGDPDNPVTAGIYRLVVRATDPSGESGGRDSDTVQVEVVVTDVNDPPEIYSGESELTVHEMDGSADDSDGARYVGLGQVLEEGATSPTPDPGRPNVYLVTDDDALETHIWTEPIAGPDGALFEYSSADTGYGRRLHFRSPPDYEDPRDADGDNVYELTLGVVDSGGAAAQRDIRVRVLNLNEAGSLTITPGQPLEGIPVTAVLTDPDGILSITDWRWATSSTDVGEFPENGVVDGVFAGSYEGKAGEFLWAMVEYRDGASVEDVPVTVIDERNDDPVTPADSAVETDHDSDEMLSAGSDNAVQAVQATGTSTVHTPMTIDLEIAENTPGTGYAGAPAAGLGIRKMTGVFDNGMFVFAEDHDSRYDGYYDEALAPMEDPDDKVDQLVLKPGNHLDHEGASNRYVIEMPVSGGGAAAAGAVIVNITVTDVNEPPSIPQRATVWPEDTAGGPGTGPVFDTSTTTRQVAENTSPGTGIGAPVTATHPDPHETLTYSITGDAAGQFDMASSTGQLLTKEPLDYETLNTHVVAVTASDSAGEAATTSVTIVVTNVGLDTRYDADDSGTIEREEILQAVRDYFAGGPDAPDREEILELISIYLSGQDS